MLTVLKIISCKFFFKLKNKPLLQYTIFQEWQGGFWRVKIHCLLRNTFIHKKHIHRAIVAIYRDACQPMTPAYRKACTASLFQAKEVRKDLTSGDILPARRLLSRLNKFCHMRERGEGWEIRNNNLKTNQSSPLGQNKNKTNPWQLLFGCLDDMVSSDFVGSMRSWGFAAVIATLSKYKPVSTFVKQ